MNRRVIGLTTSYPLYEDSCAGVFIRSLYSNLPSDWTVQVVCPDDNRESGIYSSIGPCVHRVRYAPRSWQSLAQQSGGVVSGLRHARWRIVLIPTMLLALAWRCLRYAKQADIVHANWALCGAIAALVGKVCGIPVVTTLRGDDVTRARRSFYERWLLNVAVRGSQRIVCVSSAMSAELRALYPRQATRIYTCLNGVDATFFDVSRQMPASNYIRVVAVGSLIPRKGYDVLVDAVAQTQCRDRIQITIVGEGPFKSELMERMVQKGVAGQFQLIGEVSPNRIPDILARADIFALLSRAEGRPNVVVEALASGVPVIVSRLPGIEGLVVDGENGWVVDVNDSAAVALALDHAVLDSHERCRRGMAARDAMRKLDQTWSSTATRYSEIFLEAMHAKGRVTS